MKKIVTTIATTLMLSGCYMTASDYASDQANKSCGVTVNVNNAPWIRYENCLEKEKDFSQAVACGKNQQQNYCKKMKDCTVETKVIEYVDGLLLKVEGGKLREDKARLNIQKYFDKIQVKAKEEAIAHNDKVFDCHQRVYPELLQGEAGRRAMRSEALRDAIANMPTPEIPKRTYTNCNVFGSQVNCTSY